MHIGKEGLGCGGRSQQGRAGCARAGWWRPRGLRPYSFFSNLQYCDFLHSVAKANAYHNNFGKPFLTENNFLYSVVKTIVCRNSFVEPGWLVATIVCRNTKGSQLLWLSYLCVIIIFICESHTIILGSKR